MGIEPTDRMLYIRPNGFEDRGKHQLNKHSRFVICRVFSHLCEMVQYPTTPYYSRE